MVFKRFVYYLCIVCIVAFFLNKIFNEKKDVLDIDLSNICPNSKNTEFILNFEERNITIADPLSMVKKIYIFKNDFMNKFTIKCNGKKRFFLLRNGAILKTFDDSIDVGKITQKLHGYMGVFTKNSCYYVDKKGYFWGNIDSRTMDNAPKEIEKYCNKKAEAKGSNNNDNSLTTR